MEKIRVYIQSLLSNNPLLANFRDKIGVVLSGSRAVGYHVPSSDYDFLGLCDFETYARIASLAGNAASAAGIDILRPNEKAVELGDDASADMTLFERGCIEQALRSYNDVVTWIWMNSRIVVDSGNIIQSLKQGFGQYPREILEQKLKYHWLRDFDLSVHSMTYHAESLNLFSVVFTLSSKIAEFCKLCCLLEGKPFPYNKWLLRACQDTEVGAVLSPLFKRVLKIITSLGNNLGDNWTMVKEAIEIMDTAACDIMEDALIKWGIGREWIDNSLHELGKVLLH